MHLWLLIERNPTINKKQRGIFETGLPLLQWRHFLLLYLVQHLWLLTSLVAEIVQVYTEKNCCCFINLLVLSVSAVARTPLGAGEPLLSDFLTFCQGWWAGSCTGDALSSVGDPRSHMRCVSSEDHEWGLCPYLGHPDWSPRCVHTSAPGLELSLGRTGSWILSNDTRKTL